MSDEKKILNDQEVENVSGGYRGADGVFWQEGSVIWYRIASGDTLSQIAQRAQVSLGQLLMLNPQIKNPDVIRANDVIRIR